MRVAGDAQVRLARALILPFVLICIALPLVSAQEPDPVRLEKNFLISSSQGQVRSVGFSYDFRGREWVALKGLGTVPARGVFHFLTPADTLEFFDPATGLSLATVPLTNSSQMMGRATIALPAQTDFPAAFRTGRWQGNGAFQVHLANVLNAQFPSGYMVLQVDQVNAVLTTFRNLDDVAEPLFGRVALMIEPPADQSPGATFRVRFTSQERRSRTDWRELTSDDVLRAVERFVTSLVRDLEGRRG